ncbi:RNA pseudouridine synthase [Spirochaetia bacterium]|nr:RNA pseudouridine synthase [Spirochaetia bacterium]
MKRITVLFENDACIILNKPAGLAVQGGEGIGASLDAILAEEWPDTRPLLVHRLDKDTSGVILTAKGRDAAAKFAALFAERDGTGRSGAGRAAGGQVDGGSLAGGIQKIYLAVCAGCPEPEAGVIRGDLEIRGAAKYAETRYAFRSMADSFALLELELGTGRMHQIRRHLAQVGHPILGDDKYGDFALNRELRKKRGLRRLLLHASRLVISGAALSAVMGSSGPSGGIDVTAPLPEYFTPWV